MNNIIITHADRDGLASAAVWLHEHSNVDQVIPIYQPDKLAGTLRALSSEAQRIFMFDLPFSPPAFDAIFEHLQRDSEFLWIDHHIPSWKSSIEKLSQLSNEHLRIVLPLSERTTAVRMTMEWIWLERAALDSSLVWLPARHLREERKIPKGMLDYLREVCGIGEQTDRVHLLDAYEEIIRRVGTTEIEYLKETLSRSVDDPDSINTEAKRLARNFRERLVQVDAYFKAAPVPDVWDVHDGVVYVKNPEVPPLKGMTRKLIGILSQRVTGSEVSVIRQKVNWLYAGASHRSKVDLMDWLSQIPGLEMGEGMKGHPYVISLKGFSVAGQSEPVGYAVDWLRNRLREKKTCER